MNPLDAKTPAALFGEDAMQDPKRLKRAYARLVRTHPPEADPKVFEHIRRLYEQAKDMAASPRTRTTVRIASDVEHTVDEVLAALQPETWRDSLAALRELARTGEISAINAGYGILCAVAPDEAYPWLTGLVDVTGAEGAIVEIVQTTFAILPGRARDPALEPLLAALSTPAARRLRVSRLHVLATFHPERAAEFWRHDQPELTADIDALVYILVEVMRDLRWELTADELRALLELVDDARLPFTDDHVEHLQVCLHAALAATHVTDPALQPVLDALRTGHRQDASGCALALRDLQTVTDDPLKLVMRLEREHPGVAAALYDMVEQVAHTDDFLLAWGVNGQAQAPADLQEEWWLRTVERLANEAIEHPSIPPEPKPILGFFPTIWHLLGIVAGTVFGCFAVASAFLTSLILDGQTNAELPTSAGSAAFMGFGLAVGLFVDAVGKFRSRDRLKVTAAWNPAIDKRYTLMGQVLLESANAFGLFPHEVVGAMERLYGKPALRAVAPTIGNVPELIGSFNDAHVRRLMAADHAVEAAEADAEAES